MQVLYKSTRGKGETVTASMAILKGLSEDGGLFVPTEIPKLDVPVEKLAQMTYQETAYEVMSRFLTDFTEDELKNCIANAYDEKFDTKEIAPLHEADGPGTKIIVFYPKHGVSPIQEKQMVTQKGDNTYVVGITGNFDDAQTAVKKMFNDRELSAELNEAGFQFSSANSINIGRLVPR